MPTYGYQCEEHKHEFSVFQAMKDDPIKVCPECGSAVKRLLYPVGIVFKGSGWYVNDSRPPDKSEKAEGGASDNASSKAGDKGSEKSSDGKDASAAPKSEPSGSSDSSGASSEKSGDKPASTPAPAASGSSSSPAGK